MILIRGIISSIIIILFWQGVVMLAKLPAYILPSPVLVFESLRDYGIIILQNMVPTAIEAVFGFIISLLFGMLWALVLSYCRPIRLWFLPLLLISQALPTFAIAPLFVIWFGYGVASKIAITSLMLFFPIACSFYDGLQITPKDYLDLAEVMNGTKWKKLWCIKIPAALPSLGNGLRVAATFAPMGAVIGEWVGASKGLGFLILNSNSRMQIDLMFASLIALVVLTVSFYFLIDFLVRRTVFWVYE